MAEILGAIATGVQLAHFIKKLWNVTERLADDVREVREFLKHLTETLRCLDTVFRALDDIMDNPQLYESEDKAHIDTIKTMIVNCCDTVTKLRDTLPDLDESAGGWQTIWAGFEKSMKYRTIQKYEYYIQRYINAMQLTLLTMTFRRTSLNQVESLNIISNDEELTLFEDIDRWHLTFPSVSRGPSRCGSDITYLSPPPGLNDEQPRMPTRIDILRERSLNNKFNEVRDLEESGQFLKAAVKQNECIGHRRQLDKVRPLLFEQEADMKEHLADLQMKCSTVGLHKKALEVLVQILDDAKHQPSSPAMTERLGRLHCKIAELHLSRHMLGDLSDEKQGLKHAERAFQKFDELHIDDEQPRPSHYFVKAAKLFAISSDFEESVIARELWGNSDNVDEVDLTWDPQRDDPMPESLAWCDTQGYNISSPTFSFDALLRDGTSPLHKIVTSHDSKTLLALEQVLVEIDRIDLRNAKGQTPLQIAASIGNHHAVRLLLDHGASIQVVDSHCRSLLHLCEESDDSSSVATAKLLLNNDPDLLNRQDNGGNTTLYLACEHGKKRMVALLMERGAKANIANSEGTTPLLAAVRKYDANNHKKIIRLLLNVDPAHTAADPNQRNNVGHSSLHCAAVNGHSELVGLLLRSGAMPKLSGQNGELPVQAAKRKGHIDIYNMLTGKSKPSLLGARPLSRQTSQASGSSEESMNSLRPAHTMPTATPSVNRHFRSRDSTATQ